MLTVLAETMSLQIFDSADHPPALLPTHVAAAEARSNWDQTNALAEPLRCAEEISLAHGMNYWERMHLGWHWGMVNKWATATYSACHRQNS